MRITTNGFVVQKQDLKDVDILVTLFTNEHGLLKAVAQKAKKRSLILANLEPFQESVFIINRTENNLGTIYHIDPLLRYPGIRSSYEAYMLANQFTIIARQLLPLDMPHPALYSVYRQYLFLLSNNAYNNSERLCTDFYGAVLYAEGLASEASPVSKIQFQKAIYDYCGVLLE